MLEYICIKFHNFDIGLAAVCREVNDPVPSPLNTTVPLNSFVQVGLTIYTNLK